jgi:hypothetical protein
VTKLKTFAVVFALTFAQLMVGPLLAVTAALALVNPNYETIVLTLTLASIGAAIASAAAAFYSLAKGRATTGIQKALRTLFEGVGQTLSAIVISTLGDVVALPRLLVPLLIGVVVAALVTYVQNLAPSPA